MIHALLNEAPVSSSYVLNVLPEYPARIAKELSPLLQKADLKTYQNFLLTMYFYTYKAEDMLIHARNLAPDSRLQTYFHKMAREERGHYLLAKKDFEEFGLRVEERPEPALVSNFRNFWFGLGKQSINEFLGALYVFENVASLVGKDVIEMMQRLELTKKQSRWLRVHLEADAGHGEDALNICKQYIDENPEALLEAVAIGAQEWMNVFRYALSQKLVD
jgi:hypothetical protein